MSKITINTDPTASRQSSADPERPVPGEPFIFEAGKRKPNYKARRAAVMAVSAVTSVAGISAGINQLSPVPEQAPVLPPEVGKTLDAETPPGFEENPENFELRGGEVVPKSQEQNG